MILTPSETQRDLFTTLKKVEINEYVSYKDDPYYLALYKERNQKHRRN
jgi:hypothetical protein